MEWAPQINTMTMDQLNTEECGVCFAPLYVPSQHHEIPNSSEINVCNHRFHK